MPAEVLAQSKAFLVHRNPSSAMGVSPYKTTSAIEVHTPFHKALFSLPSSLTLSFNSLWNNVKASVISFI